MTDEERARAAADDIVDLVTNYRPIRHAYDNMSTAQHCTIDLDIAAAITTALREARADEREACASELEAMADSNTTAAMYKNLATAIRTGRG